MIRRPPRSTHCISSAASDVYKRQGNIGNGVALNLANANKWPVYVWDYDAEKTEPFNGIENVTVATLAELAEAVEVLFFVVPSTREIRLCLEGEDGIFGNH